RRTWTPRRRTRPDAPARDRRSSHPSEQHRPRARGDVAGGARLGRRLGAHGARSAVGARRGLRGDHDRLARRQSARVAGLRRAWLSPQVLRALPAHPMTRVPMLAGTRLVVVPAEDASLALRPPPPAEGIADVRAAVRDALRFPLAGEPLEALVPRRGGRATLVVEPPA